ncbi:helix-turn-helix domain-containing protein [Streptomyces sp. NPDC057702]|uniref:AraC-like ligand-binding domain-containing protein n=1 Tax=unclassified Streptomyces TaxID=2593676 RepID=UPI0036769A52
MLVTEFRTDVVHARERFALWAEFTAQSHMPNRLRSDEQDDFRAAVCGLDLGEVRVSALAHPPLEIVRTAKLVRQADPEAYQLNYFRSGSANLSVARDEASARAGDLVMMDSSRPYRGDVRGGPGEWPHMTVQFPRRMLSLPERTVASVLATPLDGSRGMAGVFTRWLTDLRARADEFTPADVPTLAAVTLDLLASVIAGRLDAERELSPRARRRALRARINAFVERHLADPTLTPQVIADAHHISLRQLQQLLAEDGTSPAAWIRRRRLERCREDLAHPRLAARPVQAVAARWGFTNPTHFSRLFRATYDMAPREYRQWRLTACANRQQPCA